MALNFNPLLSLYGNTPNGFLGSSFLNSTMGTGLGALGLFGAPVGMESGFMGGNAFGLSSFSTGSGTSSLLNLLGLPSQQNSIFGAGVFPSITAPIIGGLPSDLFGASPFSPFGLSPLGSSPFGLGNPWLTPVSSSKPKGNDSNSMASILALLLLSGSNTDKPSGTTTTTPALNARQKQLKSVIEKVFSDPDLLIKYKDDKSDVNGDGKVNNADRDILINVLSGKETNAEVREKASNAISSILGKLLTIKDSGDLEKVGLSNLDLNGSNNFDSGDLVVALRLMSGMPTWQSKPNDAQIKLANLNKEFFTNSAIKSVFPDLLDINDDLVVDEKDQLFAERVLLGEDKNAAHVDKVAAMLSGIIEGLKNGKAGGANTDILKKNTDLNGDNLLNSNDIDLVKSIILGNYTGETAQTPPANNGGGGAPPATQPPANNGGGGGQTTEPPATQPPANSGGGAPPATQPPTNNGGGGEQPTEPPATQPPATQPPTTQPPVSTSQYVITSSGLRDSIRGSRDEATSFVVSGSNNRLTLRGYHDGDAFVLGGDHNDLNVTSTGNSTSFMINATNSDIVIRGSNDGYIQLIGEASDWEEYQPATYRNKTTNTTVRAANAGKILDGDGNEFTPKVTYLTGTLGKLSGFSNVIYNDETIRNQFGRYMDYNQDGTANQLDLDMVQRLLHGEGTAEDKSMAGTMGYMYTYIMGQLANGQAGGIENNSLLQTYMDITDDGIVDSQDSANLIVFNAFTQLSA